MSQVDPFRKFAIELVWFDPAPVVKGKKIAILIDRNNPERYKMDLDFVE